MNHWKIDPNTGDYLIVNGAPVETESLTVPAYYRSKISRGRWLHAPDNDYGSDFYLLRNKAPNRKPSDVEDVSVRALQPIIDDGRASSITVTATRAGRGYAELQCEIVDAQGNPENIKILGV